MENQLDKEAVVNTDEKTNRNSSSGNAPNGMLRFLIATEKQLFMLEAACLRLFY
jgi:hypothetical protein